MKLIFGKKTADLYINQGLNNTLIDQRIFLVRNIRNIKEQNANLHSDNFCIQRINQICKSVSRQNFPDLNSNLSPTLNSDVSTTSDKDQNEFILIQNKTRKSNLFKKILLMKIYGIPESYIGHWIWLHETFGLNSKIFFSFHHLLSEVYNLDLKNENTEFKRIVEVFESEFFSTNKNLE
jgi:hypothetical protein